MLGVVLGGTGAWLVSAAEEVATARASLERIMRVQDESARARGWVQVDAGRATRALADRPWRGLGVWWIDDPTPWTGGAPHDARPQVATVDNLVFRRTRVADPVRARMQEPVYLSMGVSIDHREVLRCDNRGLYGADPPVEVRQSQDLRLIEFRCRSGMLQEGRYVQQGFVVESCPLAGKVASHVWADRDRRHAAIEGLDRAVRVSGGLLGALALGMAWAGSKTRRRRALGHAGLSPMPYRARWQRPIRPADDEARMGARLHVGVTLLCVLASGWVAWESRELYRLPTAAAMPASSLEPTEFPLVFVGALPGMVIIVDEID